MPPSLHPKTMLRLTQDRLTRGRVILKGNVGHSEYLQQQCAELTQLSPSFIKKVCQGSEGLSLTDCGQLIRGLRLPVGLLTGEHDLFGRMLVGSMPLLPLLYLKGCPEYGPKLAKLLGQLPSEKSSAVWLHELTAPVLPSVQAAQDVLAGTQPLPRLAMLQLLKALAKLPGGSVCQEEEFFGLKQQVATVAPRIATAVPLLPPAPVKSYPVASMVTTSRPPSGTKEVRMIPTVPRAPARTVSARAINPELLKVCADFADSNRLQFAKWLKPMMTSNKIGFTDIDRHLISQQIGQKNIGWNLLHGKTFWDNGRLAQVLNLLQSSVEEVAQHFNLSVAPAPTPVAVTPAVSPEEYPAPAPASAESAPSAAVVLPEPPSDMPAAPVEARPDPVSLSAEEPAVTATALPEAPQLPEVTQPPEQPAPVASRQAGPKPPKVKSEHLAAAAPAATIEQLQYAVLERLIAELKAAPPPRQQEVLARVILAFY
jgi:hypothetical protein